MKAAFSRRGGHRVAHHVHADKENAEPGDDTADVAHGLVFEEDDEHDSGEGDEGSDKPNVECDEETCHRGADIRAHDDPNRLFEFHEFGIDKADDHDRGGGRGLNHGGDSRADRNAEHGICGELVDELFHAVARNRLEVGTHHIHTVQKQREPSQKGKNHRKDFHVNSFLGLYPIGQIPFSRKNRTHYIICPDPA